MLFVPPERHLLRAKDLADARYFEPLGVDDLARVAGLSRAHFSREFRRAFGESPHAYLLTRTYGMSPTAYRATFPPASAYALVPACIVRARARPQRRTFREDMQQARA